MAAFCAEMSAKNHAAMFWSDTKLQPGCVVVQLVYMYLFCKHLLPCSALSMSYLAEQAGQRSRQKAKKAASACSCLPTGGL